MPPTAMGLPLITLQPGGSRPPTNPQKANILAILGASAIGHGHSIAEIVGLVAALGSKLGIAKSPTAPVDTELLWFNTTTNALAVFHAGSWWVLSGGAGQPLDADLAAIAALPTTAFGRSLLVGVDGAAIRALIGAGTSVLPAAIVALRLPSYRRASGNLDLAPTFFAGNFVSGDTITIGSDTLIFGSGVDVGSDFAESVTNLIAAILSYTAGIGYYGGAGVLTVMTKDYGAEANSTPLDATLAAGGSWGAATFTGGSDDYNTTTPTVIGQSCIVTHSDDTKTEWGAVSLSPAAWLPRTAGIIQRAGGDWYRQTLAADGTAEYELLPNQ